MRKIKIIDFHHIRKKISAFTDEHAENAPSDSQSRKKKRCSIGVFLHTIRDREQES